MATDLYLTRSQLETFFQSLVIDLLGMGSWVAPYNAWVAGGMIGTPPSNPFYFVRVSWPTGGAPAWGITEDICFIQVLVENDSISRQRTKDYTDIDGVNANQDTRYTRVVRAGLVLYGPNSLDNAGSVQDQIFYQSNHDTLACSNLYIVPDERMPQRIPELFDGQWWERADIAFRFNELVSRNTTVQWVESLEIITQSNVMVSPDSVTITPTNHPIQPE